MRNGLITVLYMLNFEMTFMRISHYTQTLRHEKEKLTYFTDMVNFRQT